jgi:archaellin
MHHAGPRGQDGFIREILWVFLAIVVVAAVLLDAMAVFGAHQSVGDDADTAARAARTEYAQTLDLAQARIAATQYLAKSGDKLVLFKVNPQPGSQPSFTIKAKRHANTYVLKYLRYVGLKRWVAQTTNPTASRTSQ